MPTAVTFFLSVLSLKIGKFNDSQVLLYGANIPELKEVKVTEEYAEFGAAVTITELGRAVAHIQSQVSGNKWIMILLSACFLV